MADYVPFGGAAYFALFGLLAFSRAMDFLSTWIATPNLVLEGNPIAKKLGWKWSIALSLVFCVAFAVSPLPAIVISTTSILVAGRNFQAAWLMRSMGEEAYRQWFLEQISRARLPFFFLCLLGETALTGLVGAALLRFSGMESVPFAIGLGILAYAAIVLFYTALSLWRLRRRMG